MHGAWNISRQGGLQRRMRGPTALLIGAALLVALLAFRVGQQAATGGCSDIAPQLQQVRDYLAQGQPELALAVAQTALSQQRPKVCPPAKTAAAQLWYQASMQALLATPALDLSTAGQLPLRWRAIEQRATGFGLAASDREAPMTVATDAYGRGLWALAQAAFLQAWQAGQVGAEAVGRYYAILRNYGHSLAFAGTTPTTDRQLLDEGTRFLSTAQAIGAAYHLPNLEALQDLQQLGYDGTNLPAPDITDPVLGAGRA